MDRVAYFSMEIGFDPAVQTYSGGLGILAGDMLKACADLSIPLVGVTLLSEQGYFKQVLKPEDGSQTEEPFPWDKSGLKLLDAKVSVQIEQRAVAIQAWQATLKGVSGFEVPILLLDTNLPENNEQDRNITSFLYGGDQLYRFKQEVVLGVGGVRMLDALGYRIVRYHMNEGHAALLAVELLNRQESRTLGIEAVKRMCLFTTHTPVAAGHDQFPLEMVKKAKAIPPGLAKTFSADDKLDMTLLALNLSGYANSVAKKHQEVSTKLFPGYRFEYITNGVHSATWTAPEFAALFDKHVPGWRKDAQALKHPIPKEELLDAHIAAKRRLIEHLNAQYNAQLDPDAFTLCFARRATAYKRPDLIFYDIERLRKLGKQHKVQIIFAGKAHPRDAQGHELIKKIRWHIGELADTMRIVFLPNYNIGLAQMLVAGVDVWLNTPLRPLEASGTSGMKAAHNGVPSLSVLDGWWIEGWQEGITGWSIGPDDESTDDVDAADLYEKLEKVVLPLYQDKTKWAQLMQEVISKNAAYFNTHRMALQYKQAYFK